MNVKQQKMERTHPVNYVLLAVSLIIFGGLGIIFITQMELHPGWVWEEFNEANSMEMSVIKGDDIDDDGILDLVAFIDVVRWDDNDENADDIPRFGGVYALNGLNGKRLWGRDLHNPVKRVFQIIDVDGDGNNEYFVDAASVGPEWIKHPHNPGEWIPEIYPNMYFNLIINGSDREDIPILSGDNQNFTNYYIHDLVALEDLGDFKPDLVMIECELKTNTTSEWYYNISSYFVNGTKFDSVMHGESGISKENQIPEIQLFNHTSPDQILLIEQDSVSLLNTSSSGFLTPIYNNTGLIDTTDYTIIEDLNHDGISEILTSNWNGNITIISGLDGNTIRSFVIPGFETYFIDTIGTNEHDNQAFIYVKAHTYHPSTQTREVRLVILTVTESLEEVIWEEFDESQEETVELFILDEDLDEDSINEVILVKRIKPIFSPGEVARFHIISIPEHIVLGIINIEYRAQEMVTISDIDGDGKKDFTFSSHERIATLSASDPQALWKSRSFPLDFPLLITLAVFIGAGIILVALKGRKLSYSRSNVKEHKLTVAVNITAIVLISATFALFLAQLNIFNRTLITGENMTDITIFFLIVIITWYGVLPLTAALYNRLAPNFAFIFVKLRSLFFKISRSYNHDIIVLDMGERKEIGTIIQLKRTLLPLMLSIATGFYAYSLLAPLLGYPSNFEVFGSNEFFQFMNGYMLCCILPMILAFLVFSFFISGNFLLDDAGIVYFRQSKKYRQPGDIEPISIWAQSIIKGIAGLSAIITLIGFLAAVDFSGFYGEGEIMGFIFGILMIIVFFAGIPFLTAFSYVLLAGEIMEFSMDYNIQKLYGKMAKKGYDIIPRDITNIYPSSAPLLKKKIEKQPEDLE